MGWNCNNCGHLLKPDKYMTDMAQAQAFVKIGTAGLFLPKGESRVCFCPKCQARFLIIEGDQPRIYYHSVVVCIDDGEVFKGKWRWGIL